VIDNPSFGILKYFDHVYIGKEMDLTKQPIQLETLFRRPLPKPGIDLATEEGKLYFTKAFGNGGMNCFFRLIQHRTSTKCPLV
jgi:hypothetical protein